MSPDSKIKKRREQDFGSSDFLWEEKRKKERGIVLRLPC